MKLFLASVLMVAGVLAVAGPASAATDGAFTFEISDGEATITDYDPGAPKDAVIPDTVTDGGTDYPVTTIGGYAFLENELTSVMIPDSVTTIDAFAFSENELTSVVIPDSVTTIGYYSFRGNELTSVTIGYSVTSIDSGAFHRNALTSVTIPDSVTSIGEAAFLGSALTSVTIPDSVTYIDEHAFAGNALTSVTIPDSVTAIGDYTFSDNRLTSVVIPDSITTIGEYAFDRNPDLASVKFAGVAPSVVAAGDDSRSFDTSSGTLLLSYLWRHDASETPGGFTRPKWEGYDTQAIATVDFDVNGHGATTPDSQEVVVGEVAAEPTEMPRVSGYEFTGWRTNADASDVSDFSTEIDGDTTFYAGWQEAAQAPNDDAKRDDNDSHDNADSNNDAGGASTGTGDDNEGGVVTTGSSLPNTGGVPVGLLLIAGFALAVGATLVIRRPSQNQETKSFQFVAR